jgi:phosphatidylglycerol:prolipoprotein diacylglycerol transferase
MIEVNIDPVAFVIGTLEVRWYGIMIALGILVLVLWALWQVRKDPFLTPNTIITLAIVGLPSGIIFARLLHVIDQWEHYGRNPGDIIGGEGLSIYGAILGAVLGTWIYSKFKPFKYGHGADLVAPGIMLGQAIGRIGCFINGCCPGPDAPTTLPWGVVYLHPECAAPLGIATHPTVVYEMIFLLLLFGVAMLLKDRLKPDGSLFLIYLGSYSLWRVGIGFLRVNDPFLFGLHQAQVIGIVVAAIAIFLLIYRRVRWVKPGQSPD